MSFTKSQNIILNKLKDNANELVSLTSDLLTLEGIGCKDTYEYANSLNKYKNALLVHDEILKSDEFDMDFIIELRETILANLDEVGDRDKSLAIRILSELDDKLSDCFFLRYDRDILMVTFCLLDNYIANNKNYGLLRKNLIAIKYVLALRSFNITCECVERNFDFKDNVYVFPKIISYLDEQNDFQHFGMEEYAKNIFLHYANELLGFKNDDYSNLEENCYAIQTFFLLESAILFLEDEITWDFCETNLEIDYNNTTSIELLKKALRSKGETRKKVNFVSFVK